MEGKELLCVSKDGKRVYFDPFNSHTATHFADTPGLKELAVEALENREIATGPLWFGVNMERIVGTTDVVEVDDSDEIVWAIRTQRFEQGLVPWVKSRSAEPCQYVTVTLRPLTSETYEATSAYIGTIGDDQPFPQEPHATPESISYWTKYAFVWGSQPIEPGTVTNVCPW